MKIAETSYDMTVSIKIEIYKGREPDFELAVYCNGEEVEQWDIGNEFDTIEEIQDHLINYRETFTIDIHNEFKTNEKLKNWIQNLTNL